MVYEHYETIRDVPGFPGYRASDMGYVIGKAGRRMSPAKNYGSTRRRDWNCTSARAYEQVSMRRDDGVAKRLLIHRIICMTFNGPPPSPDHVVHHIDHDHTNHRAENLMWMHKRDHAALHTSHMQARRQAAGDF